MHSLKASSLNETFAADAFEPLPVTSGGNRHIAATVDHFTKWCEVVTAPRIDACTRARVIFDVWISRFTELYQVRGADFKSPLMREFCQVLGANRSRPRYITHKGTGLFRRQAVLSRYCS